MTPFEHDQPRYLLRIGPGIGQADHSTHRMANDRDFLKPFGLHQACQIVDVIGLAVAATDRPIGIAMAAKVRGDDMKPRPQRPRQLIPVAGMIETAVNQEQRRRRRVTPIREMKPKSLGLVVARFRGVAVLCCVHGG